MTDASVFTAFTAVVIGNSAAAAGVRIFKILWEKLRYWESQLIEQLTRAVGIGGTLFFGQTVLICRHEERNSSLKLNDREHTNCHIDEFISNRYRSYVVAVAVEANIGSRTGRERTAGSLDVKNYRVYYAYAGNGKR